MKKSLVNSIIILSFFMASCTYAFSVTAENTSKNIMPSGTLKVTVTNVPHQVCDQVINPGEKYKCEFSTEDQETITIEVFRNYPDTNNPNIEPMCRYQDTLTTDSQGHKSHKIVTEKPGDEDGACKQTGSDNNTFDIAFEFIRSK